MRSEIENYEKFLKNWGKALEENNSKKTVKWGRAADSIAMKLIEDGKEHELLSLANSANPIVRYGVAAHAKRFKIDLSLSKSIYHSLEKDSSTPKSIRAMILMSDSIDVSPK